MKNTKLEELIAFRIEQQRKMLHAKMSGRISRDKIHYLSDKEVFNIKQAVDAVVMSADNIDNMTKTTIGALV